MADILDEVLSDEKDEKRLLLFRKLFPSIIVLAVIIAIFIAGFSWYKNSEKIYNRKTGDMFVDFIFGGYEDEPLIGKSVEKVIETVNNRQAELAKLKIAEIFINNNDPQGALEKLEAIIKNKDYHEITTSFARLLWISLILDKDKILDATQVQARNYLQYFTSEEQPFFASVTLMKALFYKKNGQNDLAFEHANTLLKLKNASYFVKEQAKALLASSI